MAASYRLTKRGSQEFVEKDIVRGGYPEAMFDMVTLEDDGLMPPPMMTLTRARTDPISDFIQYNPKYHTQKCQRAKAALESREAQIEKLKAELAKQTSDYQAEIAELFVKSGTATPTSGITSGCASPKVRFGEAPKLEAEEGERVVSC